MKHKTNNLLVAASGTGGHIFPALTSIENLYKNWKISWLGIKDRCEIKLVPKKYNLYLLNIDSPRGKNLLLLIKYLQVLFTTFKVLKIIYREKIKLVFTTGGYISAPSIIAAKLLNIPVIIHESNLVPGLVTKYFGRYCNSVLLGFKETNSFLKGCNSIYTGTPLRNQFYLSHTIPSWVPLGNGPLIIIMGGSQGAKAINDSVYNLIDFFAGKDFRFVHIIGHGKDKKFKNKKIKNYIPIEFTNEIASLMQNCDLVISRAGSGSINEIIQTKTPSILIPYPNSKNNHQERNALFLVVNGSSMMIKEDENLDIKLKKSLIRIFNKKSEFNNKKNKYEILELMKQNISNLDLKDPRIEIRKIINSYWKEF